MIAAGLPRLCTGRRATRSTTRRFSASSIRIASVGTGGPLAGTIGNATYTYLFTQDRDLDPAMVARCKAAVRQACEKYIREGEAHPYRMSMPTESIQHGSYGWYFPSDMFGYDLLMAYAIQKDERLLNCALDNLGYEMGANPFGYCQQTGLGSKRNIEVVDNESTFDRIIEPVPGIPLGHWVQRVLLAEPVRQGTGAGHVSGRLAAAQPVVRWVQC